MLTAVAPLIFRRFVTFVSCFLPLLIGFCDTVSVGAADTGTLQHDSLSSTNKSSAGKTSVAFVVAVACSSSWTRLLALACGVTTAMGLSRPLSLLRFVLTGEKRFLTTGVGELLELGDGVELEVEMEIDWELFVDMAGRGRGGRSRKPRGMGDCGALRDPPPAPLFLLQYQ